MSDKRTVSGVVESVNNTGFRVGGQWFERARKAESTELPDVGASVEFTAYGNVYYRFNVNGEANDPHHRPAQPGAGHAASPAASPAPDLRPRRSDRAAALIAAATLLAGAEGTTEQVASNTLTVAQAFEAFLKEAQ